jgi:hypothetical protein
MVREPRTGGPDLISRAVPDYRESGTSTPSAGTHFDSGEQEDDKT